jgi:ABC-type dipeptide/oligopeptide/nickel transport system ATPase component
MSSNNTLLTVRDLRTYFNTEDGLVKAVNGVSFSIDSGETFAVVGESGCGKSVTAFSIMGIVPNPPGKVVGGSIEFQGKNLLNYSEHQMQKVRGSQISMVVPHPGELKTLTLPPASEMTPNTVARPRPVP